MDDPIDIAVIGAGAAGLMAAIAAGREAARLKRRLRVVVFDTREKFGAKILMSGGTRCNVTNKEVKPADYEGGSRHFIGHALEAFTPEKTRDLFEEIGVSLVLEPTGKYFPVTHSGKTVLEALVVECRRLGVLFETACIRAVKKEAELFLLENGRCWKARRVILATGGLSYPETGSDGTGYKIADSLGHSLVSTHAALTPLLTEDADWKELSGITLEACLSFFRKGKKAAERRGSFLFTHFGFSGPAALDISRFFSASTPEDRPHLEASFLPGEDEAGVLRKLKDSRHRMKQLKSALHDEFLLPARFVDTLIKRSGFEGAAPLSRVHEPALRRFIHCALHCPLEVKGVFGYKKAEVTAGGVDLKEVQVSTMGSRLVPGVYFCGEILDIDGRIGGFNFQWAWSTGTTAGKSAVAGLLPMESLGRL